MEKHVHATFRNLDDLEQATDALRRQGVLDLRFDGATPFKVEYQADNVIESLFESAADSIYHLQVAVQKSRSRQAEDTITQFGGELSSDSVY